MRARRVQPQPTQITHTHIARSELRQQNKPHGFAFLVFFFLKFHFVFEFCVFFVFSFICLKLCYLSMIFPPTFLGLRSISLARSYHSIRHTFSMLLLVLISRKLYVIILSLNVAHSLFGVCRNRNDHENGESCLSHFRTRPTR